MKLLMENWRKFVAETERTKNYGDLYLFENDSVQKVSFYDRFSTLNENDDDFKIFLEQWEKSVDYQLGLLSEGIRDDRGRTWTSKDEAGPGEAFRWGPNAEWEGRVLTPEDMGLTQEEYDYLEDFTEKYLAARGTPAHPLRDPVATHLNKKANRHMAMTSFIPFFAQGYMLLQRGGDAAGKVLSVAKKIKEKGALGKAGGIILTGLVAAAALIGIKAIMDSGGDAGEVAQQVSELADAAASADPDVGQALEQAVQNPETISEIAPELDQAVSQSAEQLGQIDGDVAQQAAQEAEKVSQQTPEMDEFASMFEDVLAQDLEAAESGAEGAQQAAEATPQMTAEEVQEMTDYWGTYQDGRPTYMNTVEQGWANADGLENFMSWDESRGIGLPDNMESGDLSRRDMRSLVRDFMREDLGAIEETFSYEAFSEDTTRSEVVDHYTNHYLGLEEQEASEFREMFEKFSTKRGPHIGGHMSGPIGRATPVDWK